MNLYHKNIEMKSILEDTNRLSQISEKMDKIIKFLKMLNSHYYKYTTIETHSKTNDFEGTYDMSYFVDRKLFGEYLEKELVELDKEYKKIVSRLGEGK